MGDWVENFPSRHSSRLSPKFMFGGTLPHTPGGPDGRGKQCRLVKFLKVNPSLPVLCSPPRGSSCTRGAAAALSKGAAAALRTASPSPAFDNGLNRALLPKAKFVICHFSDGRFSFWLLTEPREDAELLPRHRAGARSGRVLGHAYV